MCIIHIGENDESAKPCCGADLWRRCVGSYPGGRSGPSWRGLPHHREDGPAFAGSRGKGIQPRTQEVFADLGVLDRVVAAGGIYPSMREYRADGTWIEKDMAERHDPTPAEPYQIALMVPQFLTERVLRERLAELGHRVEFGTELVGFEQDEKGVTARLVGPDGEETLTARYLVGADGGRSFVRRTLGVEFPGKTLGVRAIVADVALTGLGRDAWHQFNDGDMQRMVAICRLPGPTCSNFRRPSRRRAKPISLPSAGGNDTGSDRPQRYPGAFRGLGFRLCHDARLAECYRVGRAFLVGDAAISIRRPAVRA